MNNKMRIVCLTSDKRLWLLRGFAHQWNKYFGVPITVAGFTKPDFALPKNFDFYSIGKFEDYPINKWSDALIEYLNTIKEDTVLLTLEDYWLTRKVLWDAVSVGFSLLMANKNAIRFDLTTDRLYSEGRTDFASWESIDVFVANPDQYSLSFQAGLYNRELLLSILKPGETPWETELWGSTRLNEKGYVVFGTRQWPMRYLVVVNKGRFDPTGNWMVPQRTLSLADWQELNKFNYTSPPSSV